MSPLEKLAAAIQEFVNETADEPGLVSAALVVWEQARYDDDGDVCRSVNYSMPMDGSSLSSSLGLAAAGDALIRGDLFGDDGSDDL